MAGILFMHVVTAIDIIGYHSRVYAITEKMNANNCTSDDLQGNGDG